MTIEHRSADEIERDIERERAEMSGTLNALQDKFSVNAIVSDLGSIFRGQGGQLGRSISQTVGRNPTAVALVGVGLAWLVIGQSRGPVTGASTRSSSGRPGRPNPAYNPKSDSRASPTRREDNLPMHDGDRYWFNDYGSEANRQPHSEASPQRGQDDADGIREALRHGAKSVAVSVSDAAGSFRDTAVDLTERLLSGTEGFSHEAKERILSARRMAHDARVTSQAVVHRSGRAAYNMFEDQPLIVGALAVAVGAAIGGVLPNSQVEDETLGVERDRLFAEAQRVYFDEREKAMAVLKTAAIEVRDVARDAGAGLADLLPDAKSAGEVVVGHVADAATRVADSARDEADRQDFMDKRDT